MPAHLSCSQSLPNSARLAPGGWKARAVTTPLVGVGRASTAPPRGQVAESAAGESSEAASLCSRIWSGVEVLPASYSGAGSSLSPLSNRARQPRQRCWATSCAGGARSGRSRQPAVDMSSQPTPTRPGGIQVAWRPPSDDSFQGEYFCVHCAASRTVAESATGDPSEVASFCNDARPRVTTAPASHLGAGRAPRLRR